MKFVPDPTGIRQLEREIKEKFDRLQENVAREYAGQALDVQAKALVEAAKEIGIELNEGEVVRLMTEKQATS